MTYVRKLMRLVSMRPGASPGRLVAGRGRVGRSRHRGGDGASEDSSAQTYAGKRWVTRLAPSVTPYGVDADSVAPNRAHYVYPHDASRSLVDRSSGISGVANIARPTARTV